MLHRKNHLCDDSLICDQGKLSAEVEGALNLVILIGALLVFFGIVEAVSLFVARGAEV